MAKAACFLVCNEGHRARCTSHLISKCAAIAVKVILCAVSVNTLF